MPTFGSHRTDQRLHLSGVGGLYTLAADHSRVLKVLHPTDGVWSDDRLRQEIDAFLLRYKTQRALAKDSKYWAPVHEVAAVKGSVEGDKPYPGAYRAAGAYALLDTYERSLATLFDSHVYVTNDDLRNLFTAIINGLLDAKRIAKRPHGALKLSNVLLSHSEPLAGATVRLTDPLPDGSLPARPFDKDLLDLGRLIYALVMRRPFDGCTVGPSREWKALGPNGEDWRKLAGALLDTGESTNPDDRDLEHILPRIATWTLQPKKAPVIPIAIAAALLIAAGSVGLYFLLRAPRADYSQANWARLCLSYDSWFGDFVDAATDPASEKKFAADPADYPAQVIALLNAAGPKLPTYKPTALARSGHSLSDLAVHPTEDAKSGVNAYTTGEALKLIDAVQAALAPGKDAASGWPLLTSLDQTVADYKHNGWNKPANAIADLIAAARPPVFPTLPGENAPPPKIERVDELARIEKTVTAARSVKDIQKRWDTIQATLKTLPQTHVPLLENLDKFAIDSARSPDEAGTLDDVTGLAASFARVETLLTDLSAELNRKDQTIVYDELAKDPAAQLPAGGVEALTLANYTTLPGLAKAYVQLPVDPTAKTPYTQQLDKIQTEIITVIESANKDDKNLPKILQDHQSLKDQVLHMASIAKISKNKDLLDSEVKKADALLASLLNEGDEAVTPYTVKPPDFLAQQQAYEATSPLASATPVVRDQWKQHHQEYLATIRAASQGMDHFKYADYVHYKANLATLEADYLGFDALIPVKVPGLADVMATGPDWQKAIAGHVATDYRSSALLDVMTKNLQWADGLPQVTDAAYVSYQKNRLAEFESTRVATLDLLADEETLQTRLDGLDLLPNEPAAGAKSWHDISAKWSSANSPLLADPAITAALKPISDRVTALLDLEKSTAYPAVAAAATTAPAPELALTAWRKLGTLPLSEANPLLDDELKAQAHVKTLVAADKDVAAARAAAISSELTAALPVRWNRWSDILSDAAATQHAIDLARDFDVTITPQSNPRMAFNQFFYDLRKASDSQPALSEAALKAKSTEFLASVKTLPNATDPAIQKTVDLLTKTLSQNPDQESARIGAGPKLAGWSQDAKVKDGVAIFRSPAGFTPPQAIEFDRVKVGEKYIWLSSTEVPVGLFAAVVNNASGVLPLLDNAKQPDAKKHWLTEPAQSSDDHWLSYGPRGWKILDGKMQVNDKWLDFVGGKMKMPGSDKDYPYYDPKAGPIPVPTAASPLQNVSPYMALYFASMLGARLPTSAEWQAAYTTFELPNTAKDAWNLRGSASGTQNWISQQNYAAIMSTDHALPFPDLNVFMGHLSFQIESSKEQPWTNAAVARLFPSRVSSPAGNYNGSVLWFRDVGHEPGFSPTLGSGSIHDLIGNVAEYAFDPDNAQAVIKDNKVDTATVDAKFAAAPGKLTVVGGSSLSPPELDPRVPETTPLDIQADSGFADVGFRLAYTAPIPTIDEVLSGLFADTQYLKGPKATAAASTSAR